jgi:hypothetical protein
LGSYIYLSISRADPHPKETQKPGNPKPDEKIIGTAFILPAAMIPYTIIKEANPDEVKGSATGRINFLTFGVTALVGPLFSRLIGKTFSTESNLAHFQSGALFWLVCMVLAIGLTALLRERGMREMQVRVPSPQ